MALKTAAERQRENFNRRKKQKAETNKGIPGRISGARVVTEGKKRQGRRLGPIPEEGRKFLPTPKRSPKRRTK